MKIRNGFVSNSSSSSFVIIAKDKFSTVKDVAKYIIDTCLDYNNNYLSIESIELNKLKNPNTPVHFDAFGEETYIRKIDDKIVIRTSQNIDLPSLKKLCLNDNDLSEEFYQIFSRENEDYVPYDENSGEEYDKDYNDKIYTPDCIEGLDYCHKKFHDYYILRHGFYGCHTYLGGDESCTICKSGFSKGWILKDGRKICNCQLDKYKTILSRKEKIKKVNENT